MLNGHVAGPGMDIVSHIHTRPMGHVVVIIVSSFLYLRKLVFLKFRNYIDLILILILMIFSRVCFI
jgi:hypothetical protein